MKKNEKGVILYLAMLMLSAALTTAIFVSTIFVQEYKISKEVADSLKAVYVADTAVEYAMYQVRTPATVSATTLSGLSFASKTAADIGADGSLLAVSLASVYHYLSPTACATNINIGGGNHACDIKIVLDVDKTKNVIGCPVATAATDCTLIIAKGSYGTTNRAIEIVYKNL